MYASVNYTIIGSYIDDLSAVRRQIFWTNAGL